MMVPRSAPDPRASITGDPILDKLHMRGQNKSIGGNKSNSAIVKIIEGKMKKKKKGPPVTPGGDISLGPPPQMSGSGY